MKKLLLTLLLAVISACTYAAPGQTAIISMHGKWGKPPGPLAEFLGRSGYDVTSPNLPWSGTRRYDEDYASFIEQLHQKVLALRDKGATKVVLVGHSFGANAAVAYVSQYADVDGIVLLAPGHSPERFSKTLTADDLARAQQLAADGHANDWFAFTDPNSGNRKRSMSAKVSVYLSYFHPEGLGNMPKRARQVQTPVPVLCAMSEEDGIFKLGKNYVFNAFPPHDKSVYLETGASHMATPEAVQAEVLNFIQSLE